MLKRRYSDREDIQIRKKPKNGEKIERKYASNKNVTKTSKKFSFLQKMLTCDEYNKKFM